MAIEITRAHERPRAELRAQVERLAAQLAATLKASYAWEGDRMVFARKGVDGYIDLGEREVTVYLEKSRLVPVPESWIRQQIEAQLDGFLR